jgi:menaquinol-cytochrome c reductase iron-sulfur subunit
MNSGTVSRRSVLSWSLVAAGVVTAAACSVPFIGYFISPLIKKTPDVWRDVGPVDKYKINETVEVSYQDPSPVPWSGQTVESGAWLRRTGEADFTAFALNCTHLGCPVTWKPDARIFLCPCHGGVFTEEGEVAGGPPPRPLWRHHTRVRNGHIEIETRSLPVA